MDKYMCVDCSTELRGNKATIIKKNFYSNFIWNAEILKQTVEVNTDIYPFTNLSKIIVHFLE